MKRILLALACLMFFLMPVSFATPPASINLSYNDIKSSLHVEAYHPSFNVTISYVRMMVISVNGTEVNTLYYHMQNAPVIFTDDVPVKANVGDVIKVELFCTQGGSKSEELTVTKADSPN